MNPFTESVELHPIGSCVADNIGNSELRDVLKEYYGNNEISYTVDINDEIWGEVLSYLDTCKLVKEIEVGLGKVIIYETRVVNEFLVRFEWDNGKNFVFWRNPSFNDYHIYPNYENYKYAIFENLFSGTYDEYLKQNITYGHTGPVGRKIEQLKMIPNTCLSVDK